MKKSSKLIKSLRVAEGNCSHVDVEVFYAMGGMNYFSGGVTARGLKVSVQPLHKSGCCTSFTMFSGICEHVLDMKRFNQKVLDNYVPDEALVKKLIDHVLVKNKIKLVDENLVES